MSESPNVRGFSFWRLPLGLAVAAVSLAIMILTEPRLTIVWDEGYSLGREARVRDWFHAVYDPVAFAQGWQPLYEDLVPPNRFQAPSRDQLNTRAGLFSPAVLDWFWPFAREEPDGHPPVYALIGLFGDMVAPAWEPLPRARLGPILVFSVTCGAIFSFFRSRWGLWPAVAAASAWMFQPHLFALAHYATYDGLLTSFWTGCMLSFVRAVERKGDDRSQSPRWPWVAAFAVLAAGAMGTKLTGWFVPVPFFFWAILYRDRRAILALTAGLALAIVLLIVMTPPWWHDPFTGLDRFFQSNFSRAETTPLKTLFLGRIYKTPSGSLPWYNTIVWLLLVTPIGFVVLGFSGLFRAVALARSDQIGVLFVINWMFLMILRALPHTPGHDGVRQFLPAFGILALLVGLGAAAFHTRPGVWGKSFTVISIVEGALSVGLMMPVPLSYYSPLIGGLPGAARMGMEPTYYWDSLQPEIIEWLNSHTKSDEKVLFARYPTSWLYLRHTRQFRFGILPYDPGHWAWYVVQNRPGGFRALDRDLIAHGHPATLYRKWGVPLLWVFPFSDIEAWEKSALPGLE